MNFFWLKNFFFGEDFEARKKRRKTETLVKKAEK